MTHSLPPSGQSDRNAELDTLFHAAIARATHSLSPATALLAWLDWAVHFSASPGKQMELGELALSQAQELSNYLRHSLQVKRTQQPNDLEAPLLDRRFAAPEWQQWPFNFWQQAFLATQKWWDTATHGVVGVSGHHERVVAFAARQWLDIFSPGNQLMTNPLVLQRTANEAGANLQRGVSNWVEELGRLATGEAPAGTEDFVAGRDVAITPGKVVLQNEVMELIQYAPATERVHPEPILLVPAWIMKYYILDLSPHNSLIKYLVEAGYTVFCVSWKNPGVDERDLGMEDYLEQGFHEALDAVNTIVPERQVHAVGYCLGGTLLSIAVAAMARDGDDRLASITLLAAQTDFSEPGELGLFIDESQVSLLEAQMAVKGYLKASQMAGAFQLLRTSDLLWSRLVNDYLMGEQPYMNDLMAWNADATRMPARMHSQYLRRLFLDNALSSGQYSVDGRPVSLGDITLPLFMVGTLTDHVAPWRSVHKLHYLTSAEITFALTSGGHNAGIVNPADSMRRHYQLLLRAEGGSYVAPDEWLESAPRTQGSWWPAWQQWLTERSTAPEVKPPRMGSRKYRPLDDAPGRYILEK